MKSLLATSFLFTLIPLSLRAGAYACLFVTECYGQNACEETEWEALLEPADRGGYVLRTQSDTFLEVLGDDPRGLRLAGVGEGGNFSSLSVFADGSAISAVTFFYETATSVTWLGRCEETN